MGLFEGGNLCSRVDKMSLNCERRSKRRPKRTMEITSRNFKERLPEIEAAIDSASFLAIDGEFTGLNAYRGISPFDTPSERYDKLQESARQFLLVQFGLCTFHYDPATDSFSNQAFNIYVWPRPCSRNAPDPRFLCQTSSIDFLTNQNFDFNKLFKQGVSYLRPSELEKLKNTMTGRQENRRLSQTPGTDQNRAIPIPEDQEPFLAKIHKQIEEFVKSDDQQLELEKCNGFQRRLVYQTAKEKYKDLSLTSITKTGGDRVICVIKADEEQQQNMVWLKDQAELSDLEEAFGFSRVIQKMTESGKLVVGHNMILDIAHTLNQFCGPLPETYQDFKVMTTAVFPQLLDTKLMANTIPFKQEIFNSSLEELHKAVCLPPYNLPPVPPKYSGSGYKADSSNFHEAGFDAYITGLCFIAMSNRLGLLCGAGDKTKAGRVLPDSQLVHPFLNKLYLMRIADIPYMNLAGEDLKPDRGHVFHITFPAEWKTADLVHLFSSFGYVFVSWLDDTSAFVSLKEKEMAPQVIEVLKSSSSYRIQSYKDHVAAKNMVLPTPLQYSGITPTLEKMPFMSSNGGAELKKRPLSPEQAAIKRHKSVSDDPEVVKIERKKTFEEPEWE
eukprot:GFUD01136549.1.p1 GENE.GFUD01136549.1~~GFUD01136549.1.p1  ORF type:complete len:612 (+),score=182.67 GFUD01136549.1:44-1879(+)